VSTFVDTNVLIYAHDRTQGRHHEIASTIVAGLWESGGGMLSTQVLQELYVNLSRKLRKPMSRPRARTVIERYMAWPIHQVESADILAAAELEHRHTLAFWDALLVVAAQRLGAARILTEDMQPGRSFGGVRIENPFS